MRKEHAIVEWHDIMQNQGNLMRMAADIVSKSLVDPRMTVEEASNLHRTIESGAQMFESMVTAMDEYDLHDSFHDAAETMQDMWGDLSAVTARKVRTLRSFEPTEMREIRKANNG